jgi:bifunctional DNA-binding transcriptional regulator/antitoxin component of YhaV-PrlF toxin-antitoxin module
MTTVGTRYQIVIERQAREALGIAPGWEAIQRVVDGHLELYFVPPQHNESLAGVFHAYARPGPIDPAAEKQAAWEAHVRERWGRG